MLRARLPTVGRSLLARRSFAFTPRIMSEGDTGATRPGGVASSDAFTSRRKANEDMYIREEELAKLKALREKIKQAQAHMNELERHVEETFRDQGGEKN